MKNEGFTTVAESALLKCVLALVAFSSAAYGKKSSISAFLVNYCISVEVGAELELDDQPLK